MTKCQRKNHIWIWLIHDHDECVKCGKRRYVNVYKQIFRSVRKSPYLRILSGGA